MNRTVRWPFIASRSCAWLIAARTSATPDETADRAIISAPMASARRRARVVLPEPGGPHRTSDARCPRSSARRSGPRSPTRCSCPTNSSSDRGRIRAASGWAPGGGWNRGSGLAPPAFVRVVGMRPVYGPLPEARRCSKSTTSDPKRHHQVPKFYLERFASDGRLAVRWCDGKAFETSPLNVAVESGFYDIPDGAGGTSKEVETGLANIEGMADAALRIMDMD